MKHIFIAVLFILCLPAFSQVSGKVLYEEKMDLHRNIPEDRQEMKEMIPNYNTSMFELIFSADSSIYQRQKDAVESTPTTTSSGGPPMGMKWGKENRMVYKNLGDDKMVDSREFMQKQFLIRGFPTERKWKIGKGQKEILGYHCMEASFVIDSTTSLVTWFTPEIAVSNGPADYQGLPGLILGVDINDGWRTITATDVKLEPVDPSIIVVPTKGKEVTAEEFEKIRKEKMKEMHMQGGGGGGQQMIMIKQ